MADYYVSQLRGSDSNAGTSTAAPWKRLVKTVGTTGVMIPGNRFFLERGSVFPERWLFDTKHQGSPSAPIVIEPYGDPSLPAPKITGASNSEAIRFEGSVNAVIGVSYATGSSGTLTLTTAAAHGITTSTVGGSLAPWIEITLASPSRWNFIAQVASVPTTTTLTVTGVNNLVASDGTTVVGAGLSVGAQTLTSAGRLTMPKFIVMRGVNVENDPIAMCVAGRACAVQSGVGVADGGTVYTRGSGYYGINITQGADRVLVSNFRAAGFAAGVNTSKQTANVHLDGVCELNGMVQEWGKNSGSEPTVSSWSFAAGTLTVTTAAAHGFATGDVVTLWKDGVVAYVDRQACTVLNATQFTVTPKPYPAYADYGQTPTSTTDPLTLSGTVKVFGMRAADTDDQLGAWGAMVRGINPRVNLTCRWNMSGVLRPTDPGVRAGGSSSISGSNKKMSNGCELGWTINTAGNDGALIRLRTNDRTASEIGSDNASITAASTSGTAGSYTTTVTTSGTHPFDVGHYAQILNTSFDGYYLVTGTPASNQFTIWTPTSPTVTDATGIATTVADGVVYADIVHITDSAQARTITTRGDNKRINGDFGPVTNVTMRRVISILSASDAFPISASGGLQIGYLRIYDSLLVGGKNAVSSDISDLAQLLMRNNLVYGKTKNWDQDTGTTNSVPAAQRLDKMTGELLLAAADNFDEAEQLARQVIAAKAV